MHQYYVETVKQALMDLFGDTSVSRETTLEDMKEIKERVQEYISGLEEDIRRSG